MQNPIIKNRRHLRIEGNKRFQEHFHNTHNNNYYYHSHGKYEADCFPKPPQTKNH